MALILVCAGATLWLDYRSQKREYSYLHEKMARILELKEPILDFYNGKIEKIEDFEADKVMRFKDAVSELREITSDEKLCELDVYKNWSERGESMRDNCKGLKAMAEKAWRAAEVSEKLGALAQKLKEGKEIATSEYEKLRNSDNEFLRQFGDDFAEYRKKVDEFREKYANGAVDKLKMQEDYGIVQNMGVELAEKYKEDKEEFKFLKEMTSNAVLENFANARQLANWAQERM